MLTMLARFAMPKWLGELLAGLAAVIAIIAGAQICLTHQYHQGERAADARHAVIDQTNSAKAEAERARLNRLLAVAQAQLNAAKAVVDQLQGELSHVQTSNAALQSDLATGRQRLRVALAVRAAGQAGAAASASAGGLDTQPAATAELDPIAAQRTAELTGIGDSAIVRLNACIIRYDALKKAVDSAP